MQGIKIIAVGRLKEKFFIEAQAEYVKRISRFCPVDVIELAEQRLEENPSPAQIAAALKKEAEAIRTKIPAGYASAVLSIEGQGYDSRAFSELLTGGQKNRLAFIIGGSFGLDEELKGASEHRISMSAMTFPHHLARIMLLEQIYRGYTLEAGGRYHK